MKNTMLDMTTPSMDCWSSSVVTHIAEKNLRMTDHNNITQESVRVLTN